MNISKYVDIIQTCHLLSKALTFYIFIVLLW